MELLTAAAERPLPLRKRPDLQFQKAMFQNQRSWIVKDPLALKYHRMQDAERSVLDMLDGQTSLAEIRDRLQAEHPTRLVRLGTIQRLISSLYRTGMLISDAPNQASQLLTRRQQSRRRKITGQFSNILAIRLPGFDPEPILGRIYPALGWIFSSVAMLAWLVLMLAASTLVLTHFDEFQRRLPGLFEFFSVKNFFWLAVVMVITKVGHEFGHGLACKHFGGECHEIGVLLLVFTPALYCDTSDSWLCPNKWHRALIGAAGMYIEVFLASVATFLWWYTQPGTFNFMCLNVMFVSSVSTVIFNANPLLRYDGYYILSDILEIPNLSSKATTALTDLLRVHCLGMKPSRSEPMTLRTRIAFSIYSVMSFAYRWFILGVIMWMAFRIFRPFGLQFVGYLVIALSIFGLVLMPVWRAGKYLLVPGRMQEVKRARLITSLVVTAGGLGALWFVPLPRSVVAHLVLQPADADRVYVPVTGAIGEVLVQPGDRVQQDQLLAKLESPALELKMAELEGKVAQQSAYVQNLRRRMGGVSHTAWLLTAAETALIELQKQQAQLRNDQARLELRAARDGTIIPAADVDEPVSTSRGPLPTWHGSPLDRANLGATLKSGTLLCMVGEPGVMLATLMIGQREVELVEPGQRAALIVESVPGKRFYGKVREVASLDVEQTPRELTGAAGGAMPTRTSDRGQQQPMFVTYQAHVPIRDEEGVLLPGYRGRAKIRVAAVPLGRRIMRFLRNTVSFRH